MPIEVKSSVRYTLTSLNKCVNKYANSLAEAVVIHTKDLAWEKGVLYVPVYMTMFL